MVVETTCIEGLTNILYHYFYNIQILHKTKKIITLSHIPAKTLKNRDNVFITFGYDNKIKIITKKFDQQANIKLFIHNSSFCTMRHYTTGYSTYR